jgi:outer membrane protein OmpA-like peptidoglycan-associated protein
MKIYFMKKIQILAMIVFASIGTNAQTNYVSNGSFEDYGKKKPKELGQIDLAINWKSPTLAKADLYMVGNKNPLISAPANALGEESPASGQLYAGIRAFSYKSKDPRTYIQARLSTPLEAGKKYCIKFSASLSDLSKYAINNLGIYVSSDAVSAENSDILKFKAQIIKKENPAIDKLAMWEDICGVFKATGGEEYITIGNFNEDAQTLQTKVKRPAGFNKPQIAQAYYYIDDVSVYSLEEVEACICGKLTGLEKAETIERNFQSDTSKKAMQEELEKEKREKAAAAAAAANKNANTILLDFDVNKFAMPAGAEFDIDPVLEDMKKKENASVKIEIISHIDKSEPEPLSDKRASVVQKYIQSKGISKERIIIKSMKATQPLDTGTGDDAKQKNARVELKLIK